MTKMTKNGSIVIPREIRDYIGAFPGMKFDFSLSDGKILLKPYNYTCTVCKKEIPDGAPSDYCPECSSKRSVDIY